MNRPVTRIEDTAGNLQTCNQNWTFFDAYTGFYGTKVPFFEALRRFLPSSSQVYYEPHKHRFICGTIPHVRRDSCKSSVVKFLAKSAQGSVTISGVKGVFS